MNHGVCGLVTLGREKDTHCSSIVDNASAFNVAAIALRRVFFCALSAVLIGLAISIRVLRIEASIYTKFACGKRRYLRDFPIHRMANPPKYRQCSKG